MPPVLPKRRPYRVIQNRVIADGTFELTFAPADGDPMFSFIAGQWMMLELPDPNGGKVWKGAFSISSAPHEAGESFQIAVKLYGDFTKRLEQLKPGDVIDAQGPYGVFTLRPGTSPLVIFAGGVGFTPFRSMIRTVCSTGDSREVYLFYSNRTRAEVAYEEEFRELAKQYPHFHPIFILTREAPEDWDGEVRRFDAEMLKKYVPDVAASEYLVCGPKAFMESVRDMLVAEGIDIKTKLRKEIFD